MLSGISPAIDIIFLPSYIIAQCIGNKLVGTYAKEGAAIYDTVQFLLSAGIIGFIFCNVPMSNVPK